MRTISLIFRYRGRGRWVEISEDQFELFHLGFAQISHEGGKTIRLARLRVEVAPPRPQHVTQFDFFMAPVDRNGRLDRGDINKLLKAIIQDLTEKGPAAERVIWERWFKRYLNWKPRQKAIESLRPELARKGLLL